MQAATRIGVSSLVIGLTPIGFSTFRSEPVTSVQAALSGSPGIAYGIIVGSNIANILLILGIAALLAPIAMSSNALTRDSAIMVTVSVAYRGIDADGFCRRGYFRAGAVGLCACRLPEERAAAPDGAHGVAFDKSLALQEADPALAPRLRLADPLSSRS
ncbi:hypothetical protein [Sulfitobacter sp. HI0021]|uniref:hypothetical protein n=1 Tax=Sulfitobacter sp. HI0021 TaxID=1822224 RepID=UPI001EF122FE|nr:hypothetical protein [Sulfitobacter sp. HI0021]